SMAVGAIDSCLTSATANPNNHDHAAQFIVKNVEDLVAWQVRLNYIGDKMKPSVFNPTPFVDNINGGTVGFLNLPLEAGTHRIVTPSQSIPPAPADGTNTPQTALVGASYQGAPTFPGSPDTPAKSPPDDGTYSAPTGGILASLTLQIVGDESGNQLFMNLDDGSPNAPGSRAVVFTSSGTQDINLASSAMGDGFHGEGVTCVPIDCTTNECPGPVTTTPPPPVITWAVAFPDRTQVSATLDAAPNANYRIDFYRDENGNATCEGTAFAGSTNVTTDSNGHVSFTTFIQANYNQTITATATDTFGNTSAYSNCWTIAIIGDPTPSASPTPTRSPTATATRTATPTPSLTATPTPTLSSFTGDTLILTPAGYRRIDSLAVGDPILSYDIEARKFIETSISYIRSRSVNDYLSVTLADGGSIRVTQEHPIYDATSKGYRPIKEFGPGDSVVRPSAGGLTPETVTSIERIAEPTTVYNLHVENENHNYVAAGILVHNKTFTPPPTASPTPSPPCCTISPTATPGTPSPSPTATATATPTPVGNTASFINTTGQTASDLHIVARTGTQRPDAQVRTNAPGCSNPTISRFNATLSHTIYNVVWPSACVDSGETVEVEFLCVCQIPVECFHWTISGQPIGTPCQDPVEGTPTATATATASPSPTPGVPTPTPTPGSAGHDARLTRVSGVPKNVRLLPGEVIADSGSIVVANQSTHSDTIGVYVDVMAPASGGCAPNGRVLQTTITLAAGAKTTIPVPVSYSCADPAASNGLSYTWVAVADHGADDLASCSPGALQSLACFNALADDDQDPADNRLSRNGPKVVAQ
ncbi:MAG: hypothetical protein E6I03_10105, partial [Chloroflexi bacterium]